MIVQTALCTHVEKKTINEALSFYYNLHSIIEKMRNEFWDISEWDRPTMNIVSLMVHGFKPPSNHPLKQKRSL